MRGGCLLVGMRRGCCEDARVRVGAVRGGRCWLMGGRCGDRIGRWARRGVCACAALVARVCGLRLARGRGEIGLGVG